jgi:PAS domain S-box-containing protein
MVDQEGNVQLSEVAASLREPEEQWRYRLLVETTKDLIWEVDENGVYTYVSPTAKEMIGYDPEEMVRKTPFEFMPPNEARRIRALFQGYVTTREGPLRLEVSRLHKNGQQLVHETNVSPVFDADGAFRGFRGISRDVTERKRMEEALQKEQEALNQLLRARDRERQIVAYEIHDGLAQKLTAATMQFQMYKHVRHKDLEESARICDVVGDLLDQCLAETRRLINDLRPPILDECGVEAAIQHLLAESRSHAGTEMSFHSEVQRVRLDPVLENAIYRIAQESLSNACRHSKSDRVRIELRQNDERVQIVVQDWGVGFDPQSVDEQCFGLAGVRERARLLGGEVDVTTGLGEGTRIAVELPITISGSDTEP